MNAANTPISNDLSETSSSCAIYKNHPLGSNETRVVQIMPSTSTDESDLISLQLSVIPLNPPPKYLAVSYMWGDPSPTKDILVDGELFPVRLNMWNFLLQKRKEQCQDSFWIDSICINQDDPSEQGHQVALMGQVYSKATEVRVWLGAGTEENWQGMQRLSKPDWYGFRTGGLCQQDPSSNKCHPLDCSMCNILPPSMSPEEYVAPVVELCKLEYWSRMWIVQEYLLASQLKIQCGPFVIDAETLEHFSSYYLRTLIGAENVFSSAMTPKNVFGRPTAFELIHLKEINLYTQGSVYNILTLLRRLHWHQCSDPRDRIYGILALNKIATEHIVPDYTKPAPELFLDVLALFKRSGWSADRGLITGLQQALQLSEDCDEVKSALAAADRGQ